MRSVSVALLTSLKNTIKPVTELAVVVSAQRGVTDQLIALAEKLPTAPDCSEVAPLIAALRKRHMTTLEGAAPDYVDEVGAVIEKRLASLQHILSAIHNLRKLTPRSKDYVISYGERLLAPVVGGALRQPGIPSTVFDGCEAGSPTTPQHGEATATVESDENRKKRIWVFSSKKRSRSLWGSWAAPGAGSSRHSAGVVALFRVHYRRWH